MLTIQFPEPAHPDSGVYMIRNKSTKFFYVGSSKRLKKRMDEHRRVLRKGEHHSVYLQRAWSKYGEPDFEFFVAHYRAPAEALELEQWWLDNAKCVYNMSRTANRPTVSEEGKVVASAKLKLVWADPGRREAARQRALVQVHHKRGPSSAAHVEKLKAVHRAKNRVYFAFGRLWALKELAEEYNVHYGMLKDRLRAGWELERAVMTPKRKGGL
jgi:group I intron endonuclease